MLLRCGSFCKRLLNRVWPVVAIFYSILFLAALLFKALYEVSFLTAFYWATVTGYTVGFGDVLPEGDLGKILCIFFIPLSGVFYAFFIGNVTATITENRNLHTDEEQDWEADAIMKIAAALNVELPPFPDSNP